MDEVTVPENTLPTKKLDDMLVDLRPKQVKFFKYYLETMNTQQSYMKAYRIKNPVIAGIAGANLLRKFRPIKKLIYELNGLGEAEITGVLKDAFQAKRQQIYKNQVFEFPDHYARMKAAELAKKFSGEADEDDKSKTGPTAAAQVVIINDKEKGIFKVVDGETLKGEQNATH